MRKPSEFDAAIYKMFNRNVDFMLRESFLFLLFMPPTALCFLSFRAEHSGVEESLTISALPPFN
jgi:hypothetical protein